MRSALDPLPRSLSIRSLAILVTMLVGGIAISVHEYLESGKAPRVAPAARSIPVEATEPCRTVENGSSPASLPFEVGPSSAQRTTTCDRPAGSEPGATSAPGIWIPDSAASGS